MHPHQFEVHDEASFSSELKLRDCLDRVLRPSSVDVTLSMTLLLLTYAETVRTGRLPMGVHRF